MALYNDRAFAFERMAKLDGLLDKEPSLEHIQAMVMDDERNLLAFAELDHYQKHGTFLYKHPILTRHKLKNDLDSLRKASPQRFMNEMVNADKNITRYNSQIKNKRYRNSDELNAWERHIRTMTEKLEVMKELISQ